MKILVVSGGISPERVVSFKSAKAVKYAIEKNGYQCKIFDLKKGYPALKKIISQFNIIFPVLHGEEGEGGKLQAFLHKTGIPYVGGSPQGFKQGWHKISFKQFCDKNNISTPKWKKVNCLKDVEKFGVPSVLKSSNGGSSLEVVILKSLKDIKSYQTQKLLNSNLPLFIEEYVSGIEVTVGILGNRVLPVIEIKPPKGEWFDYKNKYTGKTQEIINAPSLDKKTQIQVQDLALMIHKKLDLGSYSRIDFIISNNIPYVLEINTIPGLTDQSLFPKATLASGISFEELIKELIDLSFK